MIENECFLFRNPCPNRSGACLCAEPDGDSCPLYRWFKAKVMEIEKDIVPVRHGLWTMHEEGFSHEECGYFVNDNFFTPYHREKVNSWKYCPRCGAKMDGEAKEQEA